MQFKNGGPVTARDGLNLIIITPISVMLIWFVCDFCSAPVPREVVGSGGIILGYFVARHFRY